MKKEEGKKGEIDGHLYIVLAFQSLAVTIVQDVSSVASDYIFAKYGKEQLQSEFGLFKITYQINIQQSQS